MPGILVVEDDTALNNGIVLSLQQDGFVFSQAFTMKQAREQFGNRVDLIILDINLPDGSGLDFCREIRQSSSIPIIFLTANDMELDVVTGLGLGADDYITKPFSLMILRARVFAILRRAALKQTSERVTIDDFEFAFDTMEFSRKGKPIELSKTEQKLLKMLVMNQGSVLPRSVLVDRIWSDAAEYVDENALSVVINHLRNKLEDNHAQPKYIQTVYGIGYTWGLEKDEH